MPLMCGIPFEMPNPIPTCHSTRNRTNGQAENGAKREQIRIRNIWIVATAGWPGPYLTPHSTVSPRIDCGDLREHGYLFVSISLRRPEPWFTIPDRL